MDINNIFNLFTNNTPLDNTVEDTTNDPTFYVEVFNYIITNHLTTKNRLKYFLKNINVELDENYINEIGERVVFNKAFSYVKNIDTHDEEHVKIINKYKSSDFQRLLKLCMYFFQNVEEYEKCNVLKKILNILEKD
jgi:hypothetical protein